MWLCGDRRMGRSIYDCFRPDAEKKNERKNERREEGEKEREKKFRKGSEKNERL